MCSKSDCFNAISRFTQALILLFSSNCPFYNVSHDYGYECDCMKSLAVVLTFAVLGDHELHYSAIQPRGTCSWHLFISS